MWSRKHQISICMLLSISEPPSRLFIELNLGGENTKKLITQDDMRAIHKSDQNMRNMLMSKSCFLQGISLILLPVLRPCRSPADNIKQTTTKPPSLLSSPLSWLLGGLVSGWRNVLWAGVVAVAWDQLGGSAIPPNPSLSALPRQGGWLREC